MPSAELPSRYSSKDVESKWYSFWESSGYFKPVVDSKKKPFTIVIPPPNVTGILHMGHALNNTIQDILTRWHRMKQEPSLWVPGVDHAGIATQNVVEKKLAKEGKNRHQLGRGKFVEAVWKWKEEYGSTIVKQLRRLGASCDWSRERFTMDEGLSRAVCESFVTLYERGLIYRGDYIINWCPRCQTALSDEEAVHQEIEGALYYIKYPVAGDRSKNNMDISPEYVVVATTRPETMLGDTAVAINPKDERYQHLRGKKVILPLLNRVIPVIEDEFVDPEFGTGMVKVTPAHDPNDFAMGARHKLPIINVMNPDASINDEGGPYKGLDRSEARKRIVLDLQAKGLLEKIVPHRHSVSHCYRCHTIVEPYLSKQWFVKMKPLAQKALKAHRDGKVKFYPERWNKVYVSWLENIRDWCISRQIWWGHQIPVWYCDQCTEIAAGATHPRNDVPKGTAKDAVIASEAKQSKNEFIVSREDPKKCPQCGSVNLRRDPDVLDTWFSSWLWPFSTLGWPEKTKDLDYFYPTSVLVTAQEIIFFWVTRMIMAGLEFMNEVPFHSVFIHGTVRVEGGQKMSKSLGNIIDPLEIIDEMGADALRFSLMMLAATDVYLSREKFEMGRNFTNKIWNATRFVLTNLEESTDLDSRLKHAGMTDDALSSFDQWILAELDKTIIEIDDCLSHFKLSEAANAIYHFFWGSFCDWYLELVKAVLMGKESPERKPVVQAVLVHVLEKSMRLLHPFMPFISEEIWQMIGERKKLAEKTIMLTQWPSAEYGNRFDQSAARVHVFQEVVTGIRDLRTRLGLKPSEKLGFVKIIVKKDEVREYFNKNKDFRYSIFHLCQLEEMEIATEGQKAAGMVGRVYGDIEIFVGGLSPESLKAEEDRTRKKIAELEGIIRGIESRLSDSKFVANAPEEIVEKEKEKKEDLMSKLAAYKENLILFKP